MKNPFRQPTAEETLIRDQEDAAMGFLEWEKAREHAAAMSEMYLGRMKRLGIKITLVPVERTPFPEIDAQ